MKETKRKWMSFTFYDRTGIEKKLEEQAAQGWMLEKASSLGWIYRRCEPAKIHFAVTYFPSATAFDPGPSEKQRRFQEFCAHAGWELVDSNAQLQIFCNRAEHPVPIETEPEIELQNIHASVKKSFLPAWLLNMLLPVMQFGLFFQRLSWDPIRELSSLPSLISLVLWSLLLFFAGSQLWMYYRWYFKAKKAARNGLFLETKSTDWFQTVMLSCAVAALVCMTAAYNDTGIFLSMVLMLAIILIITGFVLWLSSVMKKLGISARVNRIVSYVSMIVMTLLFCGGVIWLITAQIHGSNSREDAADSYEFLGRTWYVYHDEIPLVIEDLMETGYDGYSYEQTCHADSPLLSVYMANQAPRMDALEQPELSYRIVTVKAAWMYDRCLDQMLSEFAHNYGHPEDMENWKEHQEINAAPWGADQAWQLILGGEKQNRYLLCYPGKIVEIDLEWEPTPDQMRTIGQILGT